MEKYTDRYHPEFIPGTYSIYSSALLQQQLKERNEDTIRLLENYYNSKNYKYKNGSSSEYKFEKLNSSLPTIKSRYGVILLPQPTDSQNDPYNWSVKRKSLHFIIIIAYTAYTAAVTNSASAAQDSLNELYGISYNAMNTGAGVLFVAIGLGAWLLAPAASLYGRRLPYLISMILALIGNIWFARSRNTADTIWSQLFVGACESCAEAHALLSLSSIFFRHQMGAVITVYILATSIGTYLGPLIAGYITNNLNYSWVGWWGTIIGGGLFIVFLLFFEETKFDYNLYKPKLDGDKTRNYYKRQMQKYRSQAFEDTSNQKFSNSQNSMINSSVNTNKNIVEKIHNENDTSQSNKLITDINNSLVSDPVSQNQQQQEAISPRTKRTTPPSNEVPLPKSIELKSFRNNSDRSTDVENNNNNGRDIHAVNSVQSNNSSDFRRGSVSFLGSLRSPKSPLKNNMQDLEKKAIDLLNEQVPVKTYEYNFGRDDPKWSIWQRLAIITPSPNLRGFGFKQYLLLLITNLKCAIFPPVILSSLMWGFQDSFLSFYLTTEDTTFSEAPWNYSRFQIAAMNVPCIIGAVIGCLYAGSATDYFVLWMARRNSGIVESEYRLYFSFLCGIINPIGLLMFGIGTEKSLDWRVIYVGLGFIGFGWGVSGDLAMTYLIDSYPELVLETMVIVAVFNNAIGCLFTFVCSLWLETSGVQNTYIALAVINFFVMFLLTIPYIYFAKTWRKWTKNTYVDLVESREGF
ncbi:unnamed protein product [[Candida] boidinii]|uniref:Unnamed protein product n=1 Tax=Candida boidinii TaxID=5477 RepID=A0A9W6WFD5_CANBO|nr:unnamed protein product [[Candida] boidinii]GMF99199.1 unnamed protein product [[Candida] boidinii]